MKTLVSAVSLTILAVHLSAVPSASFKQGPRPIDAVANGIGRWVPDHCLRNGRRKERKAIRLQGEKSPRRCLHGSLLSLEQEVCPDLGGIEKAYGPNGAFVFGQIQLPSRGPKKICVKWSESKDSKDPSSWTKTNP